MQAVHQSLWVSAKVFILLTTSSLQIVFTPENGGDRDGAGRFKALRQPLSLRAGFKGVLAADGYGPTVKNGNSEGAAPTWTLNTDAGKVDYGTEALFGSVFFVVCCSLDVDSSGWPGSPKPARLLIT